MKFSLQDYRTLVKKLSRFRKIIQLEYGKIKKKIQN